MTTHSSFRFIKYSGAVPRFAGVTVGSDEAEEWSIEWRLSEPGLMRLYGSAIEDGVRAACLEHAKRGGTPGRITVFELVETACDTTPDAVRCASFGATWKALGHPQEQVLLEWDGEWSARVQ